MKQRATGLLALAAAGALLIAGCGDVGTDSTTRGTTKGTAPVVSSIPGSPGGTLPAPFAVQTMDGIQLKTNMIADVHEPTALVARSTTNALYVAQKDGRIKVINVDKVTDRNGDVIRTNYRLNNSPILDLSRSTIAEAQRGLLSLTFSSDGRKLYVFYTDGKNGTILVDEYQMNEDAVDLRSRRNVLTLDHPAKDDVGGQITFGPDGYLYVGLGDGGGDGDPDKNGQNTTTLYGKILRLDPEGWTKELGYAFPGGNPFRDGAKGRAEIWTFGLHNPWRFTFDRLTKDLWVADSGEATNEEIDFLPFSKGGAGRGSNLGWNEMEGNDPFQGGKAPPGYIPPLFTYKHDGGQCAVIGGYVYRGKSILELSGVYLYADYCVGEVRGLLRLPTGDVVDRGFGITVPTGNLEGNGAVTSFGQDNDGEIYVLSALGGVYRIESAAPPPPPSTTTTVKK